MTKPDKMDLILQLILDLCVFWTLKTLSYDQTQPVRLKFQKILTDLEIAEKAKKRIFHGNPKIFKSHSVFQSPKEQYSKSIAKLNLSFQVWSHGGSTFKKKRTRNSYFPRLAYTDPCVPFIYAHTL